MSGFRVINDLIREAFISLEEAKDPAPRKTAGIILSRVTGLDEASLISKSGETIPSTQVECFNEMISRRIAGEPLQYILGEWEFFGRNFRVTQAAFIPRPETELIIESVKKYYNPDDRLKILDLGTGSGAISVTLAAEFRFSEIVAADINHESLLLARDNAELNGVLNRVSLINADGLNCFPDRSLFDLIVTNPPYVPSGDFDGLQREIVSWEPEIAFSGGDDGLDFVRRIILNQPENSIRQPVIQGLLKSEGMFFSEFGWSQADEYKRIIETADNLELIETVKDLNGIPRIVICRKT